MHENSLVRVAASQYPVEFVGTWERYVDKIERMVEEAVHAGSQILLFSEYACLELVSLFSAPIQQDLQRQLHAMQTLLADYRQLYRRLAHQHKLYIVAGSFPVRLPDGTFRNRAYFCAPDGSLDFQDKLIMTRWEREIWGISPGNEVKTFQTRFGMIGINICYDSEFPLIARRQAEAGARLILVPSATDTAAGYNRVRIGCQARALENQCYVAMAPLVGRAEWSEAIDINMGAAGVFTPVDRGFPSDGILSLGQMDAPQWLVTEMDLATVDYIRESGAVTNHVDWDKQHHLCAISITEDWLTPAMVTAVIQEKRAQAQAAVPVAGEAVY
ncbi:MAG: carbon-nitrogen hydrolase family protein [Caldilineaceae bacterium]|nr:carbon-nitrogen hydrolase family protein [Caldilineaceae bacterium]